MKRKKSGALLIFVGALLIVIFIVGMNVDRNPAFLQQKYRYDAALEWFGAFCAAIWLPAGIIEKASRHESKRIFFISCCLGLIPVSKWKAKDTDRF